MIDPSVFGKHFNIALQFSGGRDSLACLYVMKPYWDRLTVYHLDSGDAFPETKQIIERVSKEVPSFVSIPGRVHEVQTTLGMPSDLVPVTANRIGFDLGVNSRPLQVDRYTCCYLSIMAPMHERMLEDNVTLVIRGQKNADSFKATTRSGDKIGGIEFFYPIEDWSEAEVAEYLSSNGIALPRFYESMNGMPDCQCCTAWWGEGRSEYIKKYHPELHREYQNGLTVIALSLETQLAQLKKERNPS